ncbi:MAG: response regulator [Bacteroidales bacterium]
MDTNTIPTCSILIVRTDESSSSQLSMALSKTGFNVINAHNGYEAVRFLQERKDIVIAILDTDLPDINGYEVTRIIRKSGKANLVIILLAWFSVQSLEAGNAVGCNELIAKPINTEELVEIAMKWRSTKHALKPEKIKSR